MDSEWNRQQALIDLNITALVKLTYLFGNDMKKRGIGRIINLSSVAAFSAGPYMSLYYASKKFRAFIFRSIGGGAGWDRNFSDSTLPWTDIHRV